MNKTIWAIGFVTLLSSTASHAEGLESYLGLQYGTADSEGEELDYGLIRLGVMVSENMAVELRTGIGTDDTTISGITVEIEGISGIYGAYHFNFSDNTSIYGTLGWSDITVKGSMPAGSDQEKENGLSYGIGFEAYGFNVEWMQYLDTNDLEADAIAVGYNYHFK